MAAQAALASVLTVAALSKVNHPGHLTGTVRRLGITRGAAPIAWLVIIGELTAGAALAVFPHALWPRVTVALLAFAFAGAGVRALALPGPIHCSCFAPGSDGHLGWRQIAALPVWLAAATVAQLSPWHWSAGTGLIAMGIVLALLTGRRLFASISIWREVHHDRMAFQDPVSTSPFGASVNGHVLHG